MVMIYVDCESRSRLDPTPIPNSSGLVTKLLPSPADFFERGFLPRVLRVGYLLRDAGPRGVGLPHHLFPKLFHNPLPLQLGQPCVVELLAPRLQFRDSGGVGGEICLCVFFF